MTTQSIRGEHFLLHRPFSHLTFNKSVVVVSPSTLLPPPAPPASPHHHLQPSAPPAAAAPRLTGPASPAAPPAAPRFTALSFEIENPPRIMAPRHRPACRQTAQHRCPPRPAVEPPPPSSESSHPSLDASKYQPGIMCWGVTTRIRWDISPKSI